MDDTQGTSEDELGVNDDRTAEVRRYDAICDQVIEMNALVKALVEKIPQGHTQTVIHKTQGMGAWGAAAVVACFATWIGLVIMTFLINARIDKLEAWSGVFGRDLEHIKSEVKHQQPEQKR